MQYYTFSVGVIFNWCILLFGIDFQRNIYTDVLYNFMQCFVRLYISLIVLNVVKNMGAMVWVWVNHTLLWLTMDRWAMTGGQPCNLTITSKMFFQCLWVTHSITNRYMFSQATFLHTGYIVMCLFHYHFLLVLFIIVDKNVVLWGF